MSVKLQPEGASPFSGRQVDPRGGFSKFCATGFRLRRGHRRSNVRATFVGIPAITKHIICDARCYFTDQERMDGYRLYRAASYFPAQNGITSTPTRRSRCISRRPSSRPSARSARVRPCFAHAFAIFCKPGRIGNGGAGERDHRSQIGRDVRRREAVQEDVHQTDLLLVVICHGRDRITARGWKANNAAEFAIPNFIVKRMNKCGGSRLSRSNCTPPTS